MHIGLITDTLRKDKTGIGFYTQGLINALLKYSANNRYYSIDTQNQDIQGMQNISIKNPLPFGKKIIWYNYLPYALRNLTLDYIFNFYSIPHYFQFKQKEVLFIYDISTLTLPKFHNARSHLIYKLLYQRTITNAHKIVVDSQFTKDSLIDFCGLLENKIHVMYIPYKYNSIKKIQLDVKPYILNVNSIEPRKNIINLINAFDYLKDKHQIPHNLVIVGKLGWKYNQILNRISNSKFKSDIILTGYIEDSQKNYLYLNADVFVYPSYYEGLGIPIFEAALMNCPIVCGKIPMLYEHLKNNAVIIDPNNHKTIANGILAIINDKTIRSKLTNEAFIEAEKLISEEYIKSQIIHFKKFLDQ